MARPARTSPTPLLLLFPPLSISLAPGPNESSSPAPSISPAKRSPPCREIPAPSKIARSDWLVAASLRRGVCFLRHGDTAPWLHPFHHDHRHRVMLRVAQRDRQLRYLQLVRE